MTEMIIAVPITIPRAAYISGEISGAETMVLLTDAGSALVSAIKADPVVLAMIMEVVGV